MHSSLASIVVIALLVIFSMYRRVRRTIGFQAFRPKSLLFRTVIFLVVAAMLVISGLTAPVSFIGDALGVIIGGTLVYFAIKTTTFESRNGVWFYRPNPWLGAALIVLFIGRIVYRYIVMIPAYTHMISGNPGTIGQNQNQFNAYASDPWTTGVFFILIAYYVGYSYFLLRTVKNLTHPTPEL